MISVHIVAESEGLMSSLSYLDLVKVLMQCQSKILSSKHLFMTAPFKMAYITQTSKEHTPI